MPNKLFVRNWDQVLITSWTTFLKLMSFPLNRTLKIHLFPRLIMSFIFPQSGLDIMEVCFLCLLLFVCVPLLWSFKHLLPPSFIHLNVSKFILCPLFKLSSDVIWSFYYKIYCCIQLMSTMLNKLVEMILVCSTLFVSKEQ